MKRKSEKEDKVRKRKTRRKENEQILRRGDDRKDLYLSR